jgi:hypothetical protein
VLLYAEHLKAVLSKVTIGGQDGTDAVLLHENEARGISEGEILVLVAINEFLCLLHVCCSYREHGCRAALELAKELDRWVMAKTSKKQCVGFRDHVGTGKGPPALSGYEIHGFGRSAMMAVARAHQSQVAA